MAKAKDFTSFINMTFGQLTILEIYHKLVLEVPHKTQNNNFKENYIEQQIKPIHNA